MGIQTNNDYFWLYDASYIYFWKLQ